MGQTRHICKNNTKVTVNRSGTISVTLYDTEIVRVTKKYITLNSGGYRTVTTKARMNQAANELNLGYRICQTDGKWVVMVNNNWQSTHYKTFRDGMKIRRFS